MLARAAALDQLAKYANAVILCKTMIIHTRDEDDARALREEAELAAELARVFARRNYNVVINNNGERRD